MAAKLDRWFETVRAACRPAQWSRGVELSRAGSVRFDRRDDDELRFLVAAGGRVVARPVTLFVDDLEWECGCDSPAEGCEHVAAVVITWKRAAEAGEDLAAAAAPAARVGYRFSRHDDGVAFERVIRTAEGSRALERSLAAFATQAPPGRRFAATQEDLAVELALGTHRRGVLPRHLVPKLFARLARCADVALDGDAVRVSAEPVLPVCRVEDDGDGFRLTLLDDPDVVEQFDNGVALCRRSTLRPIGDPRLTGRELHDLARGRRYGADEAPELVTAILPALRRRIPLDVRTTRLPETASVPPRVRVDVATEGERLSVLATLVYGDPPRARVDAGKLVHLEGPVPARDERAERRLLRRLQRQLGLAPGVREEFTGEAAVAFAARLEDFDGEVVGESHHTFRLGPPLVARVDIGDGRFAIDFDSADSGAPGAGRGGGRADPARVLRAWRAGESLVPLLEGGWAALPREWLERHGHRVADLLAARDEQGALPPSAVADVAALCAELDRPPPPAFGRLASLLSGFDGIPEAALPADLTATLRPYQRRGVDWLTFLRDAGLGALLADDMGLGKTLQALCVVRGRTLVVSPTSVLHNWAEEARRFRPALRCSIYHGPQRALDRSADLLLTTYALLRLDADVLCDEAWDTVVLDEAQAIKNPESQVAGAAFRLRADSRIALTGTPVENRLDELWSQFHFVNRGLLGGRSDFQERYANPIQSGDADAARRLRERIRPFVLRRLKDDVAPELPPRSEMVLRCELSDEERAIYEAIRAATRDEVVRRLSEGGSVLAALEALLRLRQAACHPALVPGQVAQRSAKIELLLEVLDSVVAEGRKALVFSQWTSLLDLAEEPLRAAGIDFNRLDGSTRDRAAVVAGFQSPAGPPVLLVSLKAGGTGLNLTAADHVFLLDPWWNPAVEDQAADRAHRIGQQRPVMVYRLVAEDTVEERILGLQQRKREIAEVALGGADRAAGLTREDLLELLD